jgi:hypothetical protein
MQTPALVELSGVKGPTDGPTKKKGVNGKTANSL